MGFSGPRFAARTRVVAFAGAVFLIRGAASAATVTLPAAASIVGGAPFLSDVRAFNVSYTADLTVTATYRCFIGDPCPSVAPTLTFTLGPRAAIPFDDIVAGAFGAPDTAGGVEFTFAGPESQLVVTSRLYSILPTPTVGMFIPGLRAGDAHARTVLTSIRNGGLGAGFRTNAGAFNGQGTPVTATFTIFDADGEPLGAPVVRTIGARSGVQVSGIFGEAGVADFQTGNGVIVVDATGPLFSYAAVIDNATTDPIFVVGARDALPGTPTITRTPTITFTPTVTFTPSLTFTPSQTPTTTPTFTATLTPTSTPTPTTTFTASPTRTATPNPNRIVSVTFVNGIPQFVDSVSGNSNSTITAGTTIQWNWVSGTHSTTSGTCTGTFCTPDLIWDSQVRSAPDSFAQTFNTVGTFAYYCRVHGSMMQGAVNVLP